MQRRVHWDRLALAAVEMILSTFAGAFALEKLEAAAGLEFSHHHEPVQAYLLMVVNMAVAMAVWMFFRRHGWRRTVEHCAVMLAPGLVLLPLLLLGALDGMTMMTIAHVVMLPAMVAVMVWRRAEYRGIVYCDKCGPNRGC